MLISSAAAELYFGSPEVLVPARSLTFMDGVEVAKVDDVTYIHIMFDSHQLVLSDGAWSESFQPGDMSLAGMDNEQREELLALFPEHFGADTDTSIYAAARPTVKPWEAKMLVQR